MKMIRLMLVTQDLQHIREQYYVLGGTVSNYTGLTLYAGTWYDLNAGAVNTQYAGLYNTMEIGTMWQEAYWIGIVLV